MKKIYFSLFLLFVPFLSMAADDHCTKPKEYTIDRRCYVTDEQKKKSPYNSVVALVENGENYCTGTIVSGKDDKPYLYTAKHCVTDWKYNIMHTVKIKLLNGTILTATKNNLGNYDEKNEKKHKGDWAIYSIPPTSEVKMRMIKKTIWLKSIFEYDARVVGYGTLAIMSDKQISNFKNKYINYLSSLKVAKKNSKYGIYGEGIDIRNEHVINFLADNPGLFNEADSAHLKESKCEIDGYSKNVEIGCQTWGGNSGGPVFDWLGRIMGIHTRGTRKIGGANHASGTRLVPLF